jgi:predicted N-acyltransferase
MSLEPAFKGTCLDRVAYVDRAAWNGCFPDEAESHEYYTACEAAQVRGRTGAVAVSIDDRVGAVAPVFSMQYRLDASFQNASGAFARAGRWVMGRIQLPVVCLGSPFAERCHIGVRPDLVARDRRAAVATLIDALELRAQQEGAHLVAVKDVLGTEAEEISSVLAEKGYVRLPSLPIATLDLSGFADVDEYLASLSSGTRRDLRRKLRSASAVRMEDRHDIADIHAEITALYQSVRAASRLDYGELEELPEEYFAQVARELGNRALFRLYWVGPTLAAFNLLLIEKDRIIDKFLGMRYPLARECNLYALSWVENVRLCLSRGVRTLQSGQTAYREKIRLGSHLVPASIWFKHRGPLVHRVLRAFAPLASFERNDPELA